MVAERVSTQRDILVRWIDALGTDAFQRRHITLNDLIRAVPQALQRSCQRLMQALFREGLLSPSCCDAKADGATYIAGQANGHIRFQSLKPGPMGSWSLSGSITVDNGQGSLRTIELPSELLTRLSDQLAVQHAPLQLERLGIEIDDSFANDILCLAFQRSWAAQLKRVAQGNGYRNGLEWLQVSATDTNSTAVLEQWGTLGHPWHPNYKSKLGLSAAEVIGFSPEFEARFPIILAALRTDFSHVESMDAPEPHTQWWRRHFPAAVHEWDQALVELGLSPSAYIPLPVHPWQASTTLPTLFAHEIQQQILVITAVTAFTAHPTMSFRTVTPDGSKRTPLVKLPVALRLTSAQRTISSRSVRMGPRVSQLLQTMCRLEPSLGEHLTIVSERTGVQFKSLQIDDDRAKHVAALFRDNPATLANAGELAIPVGSLFALDERGKPLLRQWVELLYGSAEPDAVLNFYAAYLAIALPGLLGFYLVYGVAFEAHQQNSFVVMSKDHRPSRLFIRDFGDLRIDREAFGHHSLTLELHDPQLTLYDDAAYVRDKLLHATFMCHLGELALLCSSHWAIPHETLWRVLADNVDLVFQQLRPKVEARRWEVEKSAILTEEWPAKALLRMQVTETSTDIVERFANPLLPYIHAR